MTPKTSDEFNNKWQFWLEKGHYGLALEKKEAIEYLDKEFRELTLNPEFKYSQIKSKFNWFCFYCEGAPSEKRVEIEANLKEIYGK